MLMSAPSGFQLAGTAPAAYERYLVPAFRTTSQELIALAALQRGERVLAVACGTGIVARLAAAAVGPTGHTVGVDVNEGMLQIARTALPPPDGAALAWQHSEATALPFAPSSFEVSFCQHGLEFFADRAAGLREIRRVLVPGGRLILRVWRDLEHQRFHPPVLTALERVMGVDAGASIRAAFTLGDAAALRALVVGAGFRQVHLRIAVNVLRYASLEAYVLGFLSAMPLAQAVAALNETARSTLLQEVTTALHMYVDDDGLVIPAESHVVIART